MRKLILTAMALGVLICAGTEQTYAQGFLDKAINGAKKIDNELNKLNGNTNKKKPGNKQQSSKNANNQNNRGERSVTPAVKSYNHALEYIAADNFDRDFTFDGRIVEPQVTSSTLIVEGDGIRNYCDFSEGMAFVVPKSGKAFFINEDGKKVFETDRRNFNRFFSQGYVLCKEEIEKTVNSRTNTIDVYVLYDKTGKKIKVLENITEAGKFDESGVAQVRHRESPCYRYVDTQGNLVFPELWSDYHVSDDLYTPFNDGLGLIIDKPTYWDSRYGYRDINGKIVIKPEFFGAEPFSDGAAVVGVGEDKDNFKWQYIDKTGKPLFDTKYSNKPKSFHHGYAIVYNRDREPFIIDKTGEKQALPCKNIREITYNNVTECYIVHSDGDASDPYYRTYILDKDLGIIANVKGTYGETDNFIIDKYGIRDGGRFVTNDGKCYKCNIYLDGFDQMDLPFAEGKVRMVLNYKGRPAPGYMNDKGEVIVLFVESEF